MKARLHTCLALCLLSGCVGEGTGQVAGTLFLAQCTDQGGIGSAGAPAPYNLQPTYFVAEPVYDDPNIPNPTNRVSIRVQSFGNNIEEADALLVTIGDVLPVAQTLGQPIAVGPTSNVRAMLLLNRTCTRQVNGMELDGTITFSKFGKTSGGAVSPKFAIYDDDPLAATFDFDLVDRRELTIAGLDAVPIAPEVGGQLAGNFDFIVRSGRGAQEFP